MQLNRFLVNVVVCVGLLWHVNAYIERRTFRERSKISCRLYKNCKTYEESDDEIRTMIPLANVTGVQPENYLVRFPFYILAERDANIVFSETQNPDWLVDSVYEIAFGGWENKRTTLLRKLQDESQSLTYSYTDEILTNGSPLKALIEITTAGDIRVFIEHALTPLIEHKDPNLLKIAYFGFTTYGQSLARFFYDCHGDEIYTPTQLAEHCEKTSTADEEHKHFVPIGANATKNPDLLVNLPVFVSAKQDAHILIASDNSSLDQIRNGYEIVIGDHMNRRVAIHSIHDGNMGTLTDVRRADIFQPNETLNALIKISKFGKVELFTKHDHTQYKLLATAKDPKYSQTPLNYLSFASSNNNTNIDFFHNCNTLPSHIDTQTATKYAPVGHPLLLDDPNFDTPIDKRNWLTSRCKYYTAQKYEYRDFFPLNEIRESQPPGYQVRLAFYAQATRNAHVLLSRSATPNIAVDNVYEFVIGGWVNSRVVIRRKKSAQDLQQVFVKPILSAQMPTKFIIEVANSGFIRLFAESDQLEPIASVFDPVVLPVKYVSFCAFDNLARFYYDCGGDRA